MQGPEARSIPAWGAAPRTPRRENQRDEGPPHPTTSSTPPKLCHPERRCSQLHREHHSRRTRYSSTYPYRQHLSHHKGCSGGWRTHEFPLLSPKPFGCPIHDDKLHRRHGWERGCPATLPSPATLLPPITYSVPKIIPSKTAQKSCQAPSGIQNRRTHWKIWEIFLAESWRSYPVQFATIKT